MALTFLDSLMIENPALFQDLSSVRLSADRFLVNNTTGLGTITYPTAIIDQLNVVDTDGTGVFTYPDAYVARLRVSEFIDCPERFTLYVSTTGNDSWSGRNINYPLRTIKKACEIAHNELVASGASPTTLNGRPRYSIKVATGDYVENNPVYVPSNVSLQGDSLRRVSIYPQNIQHDLFWVNNSTYVWGFTFRRHFAPKAAVAFPNFSDTAATAIATANLATPSGGFKPPFVTTSPYIQGCSSITQASATSLGNLSAGCGMRVDGSLAHGFLRSMVLDSYTQFNESGQGIHILNNGYAQLVSIFTICCTEGIICESGGNCSISNSNCSFGLSGIVARGTSPTPILTATLGSQGAFRTNEIRTLINTTSGTIIYPNADPNFQGIDTRKIASAPYDGLVFVIRPSNVPPGPLSASEINDVYVINNTPTKDLSASGGGHYVIETIEKLRQNYTPGPSNRVDFFLRSFASASSHTFEYIGTGVVLSQAVPALGGVTKQEDEVAFGDYGFVAFTSTDQAGDFRIGEELTIVQETATIEGDTFKRAILTLVTPLILSLE